MDKVVQIVIEKLSTETVSAGSDREKYLKEIAKPVKELEETLREDYECFISEDGRFYISYRAACAVCGFGKTFEIDEILKL